MAVVGVTAGVAAVARHLLRTRVAGGTGVSAEQWAASALAKAHSDQTWRTVAIRAAVAVHTAVATTRARVGLTARSRGPTGTRDPSFAVRIFEALVVGAPRIIERRSGRVLAAAVHPGVALGIHVAEAALAHAGADIGARVGARARAGGQRRNGSPCARAGGTGWPMTLGNPPDERARADRPCHAPRGGSVRGPRHAASVVLERRVGGPRLVTSFLLDRRVGDPRFVAGIPAAAPQCGEEERARKEKAAAHGLGSPSMNQAEGRCRHSVGGVQPSMCRRCARCDLRVAGPAEGSVPSCEVIGVGDTGGVGHGQSLPASQGAGALPPRDVRGTANDRRKTPLGAGRPAGATL